MNLVIRIFILSLIILISSCGTSKTVKCYDEKDSFIIRWGEFSESEKLLRGWQVGIDGKIYSYFSLNLTDNQTGNYVGTIEQNIFCELLNESKKLFLSNKILNVPGEKLHFIQYDDKNKNVNLLAFWVPEHYNVGNKEFKKIFLKLMNTLPNDTEFKKFMIDKEKIE